MLSVTMPYGDDVHAHSFAVQDEERAWLQRQAHTLRLGGDYVGAQSLERSVRESTGRFVLLPEPNFR